MNLGELLTLFSAFGLLSMPTYGTSVQRDRRAGEEITVQRLVVDARVSRADGDAVAGLGPSNFIVKVDGRPVSVEAVEWIADGESTTPASNGRTIVLFFQRDLRVVQATGHAVMVRNAGVLLDALSPSDRVAVVMFDSSLHLLQDFTREREVLLAAIEDSLTGNRRPAGDADGAISILDAFASDAARGVARPEDAIRLIGEALAPIEGVKSLLTFGRGFGLYTKQATLLDHRYERARESLDAARVSMFSLDMTDAGFHSLEHGLRTASQETGGAYAKTHEFPVNTIRRVARMMKGRYEITVALPSLQRGHHDVSIRLRGARGTVLARSSYVLK